MHVVTEGIELWDVGIVVAKHTLGAVQLHSKHRTFSMHVIQDETCKEYMCCGTSSSSAAQQVDQREAVVDSLHTYFCAWLALNSRSSLCCGVSAPILRY